MEFLDVELVTSLFGEAASGQFMRSCALFALAAWIHSSRVKGEIRDQMQTLVSVLKEDLAAQQKLIGTLVLRVDKIEEHLKIRGE